MRRYSLSFPRPEIGKVFGGSSANQPTHRLGRRRRPNSRELGRPLALGFVPQPNLRRRFAQSLGAWERANKMKGAKCHNITSNPRRLL